MLYVDSVALGHSQCVSQQLVSMLRRQLTYVHRVVSTVERPIIIYIYGVILLRRYIYSVRVYLSPDCSKPSSAELVGTKRLECWHASTNQRGRAVALP